MIRPVLALLTCLTLVASACGDDDDGQTGETGASQGDESEAGETDQAETGEPFFGGHQSAVYAKDANWLCRPDLQDSVCSRNLDVTVVNADGTTQVQPHEVASDPEVDCFYVYPTVNLGQDGKANADLQPSEEAEIWAAYDQAARLSSVCRVFAPIYRQATIFGGGGPGDTGPWGNAYEDVVDAFKHYIDNESQGRKFVLVGHSQGADHLRRLMMEEIDDESALRERMVSAFPLGWSINVPVDDVVGGAFQNIPVCEAPDQTGCVVGYSSYRSTNPPGQGELPPAYGTPRDGAEGMKAICANPAALGGGSAFLEPYFHVEPPPGALVGGVGVPPFQDDPARAAEITTPYVTFPDFLEAECVSDGQHSYLEITVHGDPKEDVRTHDIGGDLELIGQDWGLHVLDVNLALGNVIDLIASQVEAAT